MSLGMWEFAQFSLQHLIARWSRLITMNLRLREASSQTLACLATVRADIHDDLRFDAARFEDVCRVINPIQPEDRAVLALFADLHAGGAQQLVQDLYEGHGAGMMGR